MIVVIDNMQNDVVVTLTEKRTLQSPYYLFRFVNDLSKSEYLCIAADISSYPSRYNEFIIKTMVNTPNPLVGEIKPIGYGFYHYYIYEQTSATNLDYTQATTLLEVGKMNFITPAQAKITYAGNNTPKKVYNG